MMGDAAQSHVAPKGSTAMRATSTALVEVHGTTMDPYRIAKRHVKQNHPGVTIVYVEYAGFRCDHGFPVVQVTYRSRPTDQSEDDG